MTIMRAENHNRQKKRVEVAQFCTTGSEFHVLALRLERMFVKNVCG